jgi:CRISPR-associated DxTHG motif protein
VIILSSLGTGKYREAHYRSEHHEEVITTGLFAVALQTWHPKAKVKILATESAKSGENGQYIQDNHPEFEIVDIPEGKTETEAWALFETIASPEVLPPGERVIFDITHGLRSLPMLGFLALSYLRVVRDITVEKVYYGALDLTPRSGEKPLTPVVDLTPLVNLLDWAQAANRFKDTGDGSLFKPLLAMNQAADYNAVSRQLECLSRTMFSNRGQSISQEAEKLLRVLKRAEEGKLEVHQRPFALVMRQLEQQISPLAAPSEDEVLTLKAQHALIHWYAERGHYPQAMSLAREWLTSVRQWHELGRISMDEDEREHINNDCKAAIKALQGGDSTPSNALEPHLHEFARLSDRVSTLRNDLMHFGFKPQPTQLGQLKERINKILDDLPTAVRPLGLELEPSPETQP